MDLKGALYNVVTVAWGAVAFGAVIAIDLGHTEPWLSSSDIPGGLPGAMLGAIGVAFAGWVVVSNLNERRKTAEWQDAGRQAGFRPTSDGDGTSGPELTGTVGGRTVTARYDRRSVSGGGGDSGSTWVTFTWVGAELAGPVDDGVVVGRAGGRFRVHDGVGSFEFDEMAETISAAEGLVAVETGDLVLVGTSSAAVKAVADGLSGDALRAIRDLNIVSLGDGSGVVARWAEARNEEMEGVGSSWAEYPVENLTEHVPGDAATVTVETKTEEPIRNGDELRRFAEGVVAIADAFEGATARTPASG